MQQSYAMLIQFRDNYMMLSTLKRKCWQNTNFSDKKNSTTLPRVFRLCLREFFRPGFQMIRTKWQHRARHWHVNRRTAVKAGGI